MNYFFRLNINLYNGQYHYSFKIKYNNEKKQSITPQDSNKQKGSMLFQHKPLKMLPLGVRVNFISLTPSLVQYHKYPILQEFCHLLLQILD
jgi:hypothetical protein